MASERRLRRRERRRQRRARRSPWSRLLIVGMLSMGVGVWLLLDRLAPGGLPGPDRLWPLFPILFGVALLFTFVASGFRDSGAVFPGVAALGVGFFFLLFTLGPFEYYQMSRLWPAFPLIAGIAFFWAWVASLGRRMGLLIPAVLGTLVGVIGLFFNVIPFGPAAIAVGWPLILALGGLSLALVAVGIPVLRLIRSTR